MKTLLVVALSLGAAVSNWAAEVDSTASLLRAVRRKEATAWQALLKTKADVAGRDADGNTALHLAALNQDFDAVRALLAAGAEVDAKNTADATPLLYGAG